MIKQHSIKKCKATGKALGFETCGEVKQLHKFGMCEACFKSWLFTTQEGKKFLDRARITGKKKAGKEIKSENRRNKRDLNEKGAMGLADMYFSRYIRLKHSENGFCTCYTCGAIHPIKEVECGHYQKREHKATRYNENNNRPQDKKCNSDIKHNGKQVEFRINLINEIGLEEVEEIERLAKTSVKMSAKDYRDIADYYREKVNDLQKYMGVKWW